MDKRQELIGLLKEANQGLVDEIKEQNDTLKSEIAELKASNVEMKNKIEAIENSPVKSTKLIVPGSNKLVDVNYKGYYVPGQGTQLKMFVKPELQETLAKAFINLISKRSDSYSLKAALNETTDAQGGYLVFEEYMNEILAFARLQSFALTECRVIDTARELLNIPAENASVSVTWKAEGIAAAESEPTVTNIELKPSKLTAYSIASNEMLEDTSFDILSWLTSLFAESIGQEIDNQVINGGHAAASPFMGLLNANAGCTDSTSTNGISFEVMANVVNSLAPNKVQGSKLLLHRLNYANILKMEDSAGNALFHPSMPMPQSLWGYPVLLSEKMTSTGADGDYVAIFGNFKNYLIARRKVAGSLDIDIYGKFLEYQTRFRTVSRWDGMPWNGTAFVRVQE